MNRFARIALSVLLATALLGVATAQAEDDFEEYTKDTWPLSATKRPLTLAKGMLEVRGDTFMLNLSSDFVGKPFSLAPDIYYGVDRKLSVGITHDLGICLAGEDNGCDKVYDDVGIDVLYGLMLGGSAQFALHGGFGVPSFDPFTGGLNIGGLGRIQSGNVAVVFDPKLYVGLLERDSMKETVYLPIWLQFQINEQTMAYAMSGINGPLDGFGDAYAIPAGLGALFAVNNRIDFGAEFMFTNIGGKNHSADYRWLIVRAALRL